MRTTKRVGYDRAILYKNKMQASTPTAMPTKLSEDTTNLDTSINADQVRQLIQAGYLHSTIVGFNADYDAYINANNFAETIKNLQDRAKQDLTTALDSLNQAAGNPEEIWGEPVPQMQPTEMRNIPTLDHLSIANYMLHDSPAALASAEWISSYEKWISSFGKYRQKIIGNVRQAPFVNELIAPATRVRNATLQLVEKINQYNVLAKQSGIKTNDNKTKSIYHALDLLINFNPSIDNVGKFNSALRNLSRYFGLQSETMRDMDFVDAREINDELQAGHYRVYPAAGGSHLSDVVLEVTATQTDLPPIKTGISYKLRTFDHFDLRATFIAKDEEDQILQDIMYVYSNILALTEFARDKEVNRSGVGKRVQASAGARYNTLARGLGKVGEQAIRQFSDFIINRLLLTSFFGNSKDAKDTSLLDPTFFDKITDTYSDTDKHYAPPAYVMTAKHVYKTYDILHHYITLDRRSSEWKQLLKQQMSSSGYHYQTLIKLWHRKKELLEQEEARDPKQNVYDIFLHNLAVVTLSRVDKNKLRFTVKHSIRL